MGGDAEEDEIMKLPTNQQFLKARGRFNYAAERALLAHYANDEGRAERFKIDCIKELKAGVAELGFELVEVVSTFAKDNDGNNIEAVIPVIPEAPGGGRMDLSQVADV